MLKINAERLLNTLESLAQIGKTAAGGVSRPALSEADMAGREWFRQQIEKAGLILKEDGAGNISAVLPAKNPHAKILMAGSHLDTVPDGGRFDGALGVLCAFEALCTIQEAGIELPVHLEAVSFTDEEGELLGLMGSRALTGQLTMQEIESPHSPEKLKSGMARAGLTPESILAAKRNPDDLLAFLEVHIEQGTRLEESGVNIGVVTQIIGIRSYWLTFKGEAAHAGTMPMDRRKDALWGASEFVQRAKSLVMSAFPPGVMNCGQIFAAPGAFNIVPAEVRLALEFRHGTTAQMDEMEYALFHLLDDVVAKNNLSVEIASASHIIPSLMDENIISMIEQAAASLHLSHTRLMSFAGHDTQAMSKIVPAAMFFVPSINGISHNPNEYTHPQDVINAANVMLQTILLIAERNKP